MSVYFAAELIDPQAVVRIGGGRPGNMEIADHVWLPLDSAKARADLVEMKQVLDAALHEIQAEAAFDVA